MLNQTKTKDGSSRGRRCNFSGVLGLPATPHCPSCQTLQGGHVERILHQMVPSENLAAWASSGGPKQKRHASHFRKVSHLLFLFAILPTPTQVPDCLGEAFDKES